MTDRELLELAAKAAGFEIVDYQNWPLMEIRYGYSEAIWNGEEYWNPLVDDGDALRLIVALRLEVWHSDDLLVARWKDTDGSDADRAQSIVNGDRLYSMRRCIVRAAAEIGRSER